MPFPIEIHLRDMEPSESVERQVREWATKLEPSSARIQRCEVVVEQPHRHHQQGRRFHVRVSLTLPGRMLVVNHDPGVDGAHDDAHVAIRDALRAARRQLDEHAHADQRTAASARGVP
jgi:ribosome-associated translation inhibitor RaiA